MTQLRVLSAGAVKRAVSGVCEAFGREHGTSVEAVFATAPEVRRRIAAGEAADVVVAPPAVLDLLAADGRLAGTARHLVGIARMGLVVHESRAGLRCPDKVEEFSGLLLASGSVVHNKASSGVYAARLLEELGLNGELGSRLAIVDTGGAVMQYVAQNPDAIGLAQIPEIRVQIDKGLPIALLGPLPEEIQNVTNYQAAPLAASRTPEDAQALAGYFETPAAREICAAHGIV
jgi:molybdate transport system substrate-binding protein